MASIIHWFCGKDEYSGAIDHLVPE